MRFVKLYENFDQTPLNINWASGKFEGKLMMTVWKIRDAAFAQVTLEKSGDVWKISDKREDPVQVWYTDREDGTSNPKDLSEDMTHHISDLLDADLEKQLGKHMPELEKDPSHQEAQPVTEPEMKEPVEEARMPLMRGRKR